MYQQMQLTLKLVLPEDIGGRFKPSVGLGAIHVQVEAAHLAINIEGVGPVDGYLIAWQGPADGILLAICRGYSIREID